NRMIPSAGGSEGRSRKPTVIAKRGIHRGISDLHPKMEFGLDLRKSPSASCENAPPAARTPVPRSVKRLKNSEPVAARTKSGRRTRPLSRTPTLRARLRANGSGLVQEV